MKIAVVTDSSAGSDVFKSFPDLKLVPLMINKEDGDSFADDYKMESKDFYELLEAEYLKTSMSLPGVMTGMWDELLKTYDQVVVLTLSKGLSGQYQTTRMLSQEENYKDKVFVLDSNGVSIVQVRFIEKIYQLIEEGKNGKEIQQIVDDLNKSFVGYIIPKNLERLVRGGRISKAAAAMAKILKIVPILKYNGEIDKESKTRTFKKAIDEALNLIKEKTDHNVIDVAHSKANKELVDTVIELIKLNNLELGYIHELPNVITCHTGTETFAVLSWQK